MDGGQPGHPSTYGLLGAQFTPDAEGRIRLQAGVAAESERRLDWTLMVPPYADVRAGIPHRIVARDVLDAAERADLPSLGSGTLRFDCAAYGHGISSPLVFMWLADSLVRLLALGATATPEEVREALRRVPTLVSYHEGFRQGRWWEGVP